jgi:hypothetical protein
MPLVEIIRATADVITLSLEPDDALAINNALNEVCNGIHLDDWDFQIRMGAVVEDPSCGGRMMWMPCA